MHQVATWYRGRPQPRGLCVRWGPSPLLKKGEPPPQFLAHVHWGGSSAPFWGGRAWFPSNTKSPWPRPCSISSDILIHAAIWPQQIWAKNWGLCPFGGGRAGSPSNTMWPGPRPTRVPSFVLIRPTVWPQCTDVIDRTGHTDNGPIA